MVVMWPVFWFSLRTPINRLISWEKSFRFNTVCTNMSHRQYASVFSFCVSCPWWWIFKSPSYLCWLVESLFRNSWGKTCWRFAVNCICTNISYMNMNFTWYICILFWKSWYCWYNCWNCWNDCDCRLIIIRNNCWIIRNCSWWNNNFFSFNWG